MYVCVYHKNKDHEQSQTDCRIHLHTFHLETCWKLPQMFCQNREDAWNCIRALEERDRNPKHCWASRNQTKGEKGKAGVSHISSRANYSSHTVSLCLPCQSLCLSWYNLGQRVFFWSVSAQLLSWQLCALDVRLLEAVMLLLIVAIISFSHFVF